MIRLHYSNRLETLVAPLAALVREEQGRDPLERITVVVPNRALAEFLKLRLAERVGVAANLEFPFLRRYLAGLITDADPAVRVLEADELELAVFECLRSGLDAGEPQAEAVGTYVAAAPGGGAAQRELRLFQLSVRTARLFREYSVLRRAMLEQWPRGPALSDERSAGTERWQRWLYLALFDRGGELRPEWLAGRKCRWLLLPDAFDTAGSGRLRTALPRRLHIFALSYAGSEFVRIFSRLAALTELHVYALNPCLEFWEDVDAGLRVVAGRLARRGERVGERLQTLEDPFELQSAADNLALRLWGRPGREYIRLLNELADCDFDAHFERPPDGVAPTMLERVQESILLRKPEEGPANASASGDGSIRFLACPGIRREVESVANTVWRLLIGKDGALNQAAPLRFHQIALLLPDLARDAYLPHLEAVFSGRHEIPLNVVERRLGAASRVAEAVELLLKLPLGEFTRGEMLRVLTHPAVTGALAGADAEQWTEWCNSAGVYLGADARDFAATYIPPALYHWDQALSRLALGVFMEGAPRGETRALSVASGSEYRPYETPQDAVSSVAALVRTARSLLADALVLRSRRFTAGQWGRLLGAVVNTYVHPADPAGERVRDAVVEAFESMAAPELRSAPVSYEVACELALARIADLESDYGRYAESGVAVGSLSALRSIPFRVIFVLGLGETVFPERDRRDPLDLRRARRQAGDVSAAERDRYLFLETLLAAREKLFLSYVARDPVAGEELEPSALVRELQFVLRSWLDESALKRLTVRHRVSPYDRRYFPELRPGDAAADELGESFDRSARRGARMTALRDDLEQWRGRAPSAGRRDRLLLDEFRPELRDQLSAILRIAEPPARRGDDASRAPELVLPIAALRRFLECPLQGAARYALGMTDENDDADDSQDEPLEQDFLERTMLLREVLWLGRADRPEMERCYDALVRAARLSGRAPCGPFADAARASALAKLGRAADQAAAAGVKGLAGWRQVGIGGAEEFAHVDRTLPAITLRVRVKKPESAAWPRVKLQGRVGPVSPGLDTSIRCVAGKRAKAKDFLEGFVGAIALAAAGEEMPSRFTALAVGGAKDGGGAGQDGGEPARSFRPPSADEARDYLGRLAEDLLSGDNDYFLPVEAVEKALAQASEGDDALAEALEQVRGNERERCGSDYGPIRNARRFPAPDPARVRALIERRFGPILGIFNR